MRDERRRRTSIHGSGPPTAGSTVQPSARSMDARLRTFRGRLLAPTDAPVPRKVNIHATYSDPIEPVVRFLDRFHFELQFWPSFLASYGEYLREGGGDGSALTSVRTAITDVTLQIGRAMSILRL